jgi:hypothetical protein
MAGPALTAKYALRVVGEAGEPIKRYNDLARAELAAGLRSCRDFRPYKPAVAAFLGQSGRWPTYVVEGPVRPIAFLPVESVQQIAYWRAGRRVTGPLEEEVWKPRLHPAYALATAVLWSVIIVAFTGGFE